MKLNYPSLFLGAFFSFVVMLMISGYIISEEFVSKKSLKNSFIYIDGKAYVLEEL